MNDDGVNACIFRNTRTETIPGLTTVNRLPDAVPLGGFLCRRPQVDDFRVLRIHLNLADGGLYMPGIVESYLGPGFSTIGGLENM